jgi:hypothetical protein
MSYCKCIETVFEAVPSSLLQTYALLDSGRNDKAAVASILISGATTAFTSVMISYDYDTSPTQRAKSPKFYGFVPTGSKARAACFAAMFLLTTAHTLARTFACALLAVVSKRWLLYYLSGDALIFFAYKFARGDLRYGLNISGGAGLLTTILCRVADKIMIDFTALMQMRHPAEAGGIMWTTMLIMAQVGCYACGWFYVENFDGPQKLGSDVVWTCIIALSLVFLAASITFVAVMNRELLPSFINTENYSSYMKRWFKEIPEGNDVMKSSIFKCHPVYRRGFEREIMEWSRGSWNKWERERPVFFTDKWIDSVPNDCMPFEYCVKYRKTKGRRESDKRRGSVSVREMLGGEEEER